MGGASAAREKSTLKHEQLILSQNHPAQIPSDSIGSLPKTLYVNNVGINFLFLDTNRQK